MSDSTSRRSGGKPVRPNKPSKNFPLYAHKVGRWAKKVRGRVIYFTSWRDDPKGTAALEEWLRDKDELLAGREPAAKTEDVTVVDLVNSFLTFKEEQVKTGELQPATFREYKAVSKIVMAALGRNRPVENLRAADFEKLRAVFARKSGVVRLGKQVQMVRTIFNYGGEAGMVTVPRFGPGFKRPSTKVLRRHRAEKGPKLFSRDEVRSLLSSAGPVLKAMILLGINCGLGNADCGRLEERHLDLTAGWLHFARPKTGIDRHAKLWPETAAAIREALAVRPVPKDTAIAGRVFITMAGGAWSKDDGTSDPVALMFSRLVRSCGIEKSSGVGFYALRHTYRTVADGCRDQSAIDLTMGHSDPSMAGIYREGIEDGRLEAVAQHVRNWLFAEAPASPQPDATMADEHDQPETAANDELSSPPRLRLFAG